MMILTQLRSAHQIQIQRIEMFTKILRRAKGKSTPTLKSHHNLLSHQMRGQCQQGLHKDMTIITENRQSDY